MKSSSKVVEEVSIKQINYRIRLGFPFVVGKENHGQNREI
jgi:hypothetical protein